MATPRVSNRYPRRRERLAPNTLREFLLTPLPEGIVDRSGQGPRYLADLDEGAWQEFAEEVLVDLSERIVARVAKCHTRKSFQDRHFPRPAAGLRLADLPLENRTRRCLIREGFDEHLDKLGDMNIGQLMVIRAFGPRCLVDLLAALESAQSGRPRQTPVPGDQSESCGQLTAAARRLASLPEAELAGREDPRFAAPMHAIDVEAATAAELASRLQARRQDPPDAAYTAEQVGQLCRRIERMAGLSIEEELIDVFANTANERNRQILIGYYGWEDGRQHTLTEIGRQFGITRERVRQVCAKLTRKPEGIEHFVAPVMDRALSLIEHRLPRPADDLERFLANEGLTRIGMSLEGVTAGAKLLERPVVFRIQKIDERRLAVESSQADLALTIADVAKKEVYFHGLSTVERIQRQTSRKQTGRMSLKLVRATLPLLKGFAWLDESAGWFRLKPIAKHGLPKTIDKILAVTGSVTVGQMRTAMARNRRLWKNPPPDNVLLEFCRQTPGIRVEDDRITADPPRDWRKALAGVERKLVEVLKEHGPLMERGAMEDLCTDDGMNRFSFHAFVSWSPVIEQLGHSLYGLLGADVSRREVQELIALRRARQSPHRVLDDHGRTDDGKVWLSYRLSKAASTYAVITVPAALKKVISGRFALFSPGGQSIGTLATRDGRAWGLGAYLRRQDAKVGDRVVITIDLRNRTAVVALEAEG